MKSCCLDIEGSNIAIRIWKQYIFDIQEHKHSNYSDYIYFKCKICGNHNELFDGNEARYCIQCETIICRKCDPIYNKLDWYPNIDKTYFPYEWFNIS